MRVPQTYLDQPRWWSGQGRPWLDALPRLVDEQLARWRLTVDGAAMHGSHALVIPVLRSGRRLALRLGPPDDDTRAHTYALRFWDGHGTVRLHDVDIAHGAMLLDRLGPSLLSLPATEAMAVLGATMRRLAVPAPRHVPSTADIARARSGQLEREWQRLGRPFPLSILDMTRHVAARLSTSETCDAVNGDLHSAQVLEADDGEWTAVDPVLLRGDIAYDLGRVLWTRIDDMRDAPDVVRHFDIAVREADLDRDHARDWVLYRTVDYWLWGLSRGLTEDPLRCARLIAALNG